MIPEYLHRWLSIGIIRRLELDISDPNFIEESLNEELQLRQSQSMTNDHSLDLMKLGQMSRVESLIPEDSINREELPRSKDSRPEKLLSNLVEIPGRDGSRMSPENILGGLLGRPVVVPSLRLEIDVLIPSLMHLLYSLFVLDHLWRDQLRGGWIRQEESVMGVSCGMLLGLEEGVEIEEGGLYVLLGVHLLEAHLKEDVSELCSHLH